LFIKWIHVKKKFENIENKNTYISEATVKKIKKLLYIDAL
jgi:hypothetical protein